MKINLTEPSTLRGIAWILTAVVGTTMLFMGKDVSQLLVLATAVVGGLGLMNDKPKDPTGV